MRSEEGLPPASVAAHLRAAAARLASALALPGAEARLEARVLAAHALQVERAWLIAHDRDPLAPSRIAAIDALIARRAAGEPVAYLLGAREFHGRLFRVTPDVLIPRPETELLVAAALEHGPAETPLKVLDLCTGSGAVAVTLALERPGWCLCASDLSPAALALARRNAALLGARVEFVEGDLFAPWAGRRFELMVGNPPYVAQADPHLDQGDLRFEPRLALAAGPDGLDLIRRLAAAAPPHLVPGGALWLEHGWDQGDAVRALLAQAGFGAVRTLADLAGQPRVTGGALPA